MGAITFTQKGDFTKTQKFLEKCKRALKLSMLDRYGRLGVRALREATPKDTGLTSESWQYRIQTTRNGVSIIWENTNIVNGIPVAVLLQYGHGTAGGSYVRGIDYINPAMRPVFEKIASEAWKEVQR